MEASTNVDPIRPSVWDSLTPKRHIDISGTTIAYVDHGSGDPIVFLHGNPTSSFLWRDIIPAVSHLGRVIAPDLVGMGDSGKLPRSGRDSYRFADHRHYLDGLLAHLEVTENLTLVVHDWGSILGFDWALRHPHAVRAVAYMEAIVRPLTWVDFPVPVRSTFEALRSDAGEQLVLDDNVFVEQILPHAILRTLAPAEMAEYRRPFLTPGEDRRPTLAFPRQLPIDGDPPDVHAAVEDYSAWLATSPIPKLFVAADPGVLTGAALATCRAWPNQTEVTVRGLHYLQEDSPAAIGTALAAWLKRAAVAR